MRDGGSEDGLGKRRKKGVSISNSISISISISAPSPLTKFTSGDSEAWGDLCRDLVSSRTVLAETAGVR